MVSGNRALLKLAVVEVEGGAGHLETGIWALGLGFGPQGWDIGLEAEIWAWRWGRETKKEKIPLCESIGHRTLRGRCPKGQSCVNSKNLLGKKFEPKMILFEVFTPRGSTLGYSGVPSTKIF